MLQNPTSIAAFCTKDFKLPGQGEKPFSDQSSVPEIIWTLTFLQLIILSSDTKPIP